MASRSGSPPSSRWPTGAAIAVIGLAVWLVFRRTTEGGLLQWDDDINVLNNVHVHGLSWENIRWMFTDAQYMRRYLPLGWLRWAADYQAFGPGPRSFHVGNLLLHLADAILLFILIRRLLGILYRPVPAAWALLAALAGALSWALHPLRVETVAWISTGQYCQAIFFLLLSLLAYLGAAASPDVGGFWKRPGYGWSLLAFALSLLSYPAALGYPAALVILDFLVLARVPASGPGRPAALRWIWIEKIPFAVASGAMLVATLVSRYQARGIWERPPTLAEFGAVPRIMQACYVWAYYVWKPLWPVHLAPVYTALVEFDPAGGIFVASLAGVLAVSAVLLWQRRRWPGTLALWLCHLALLVPMLGLSEHPHYTSDRYNYLASIPWSVGLAIVLFQLWRNPGWWRALVPVAAGLLALAGVASAAQVRVWRDSETLFRYVLTTLGTDSYRYDILTRLGRTLLAQGRLAEAEASFREAVQVQPAAREARGRLGLVLFREGRTEAAAAILGPGARLVPQEAEERSALVNALVQAGWAAEALQFCEDAVRLNPRLPDAQGDLGIMLAKSGRSPEALPHLEEAILLDPQSPSARFNLGMAFRNLGRNWEARREFEAALQLQPDFRPARDAILALPAT
jgi:Flp pilus assembly protein TadD